LGHSIKSAESTPVVGDERMKALRAMGPVMRWIALGLAALVMAGCGSSGRGSSASEPLPDTSDIAGHTSTLSSSDFEHATLTRAMVKITVWTKQQLGGQIQAF
jgi:hypothetical protein